MRAGRPGRRLDALGPDVGSGGWPRAGDPHQPLLGQLHLRRRDIAAPAGGGPHRAALHGQPERVGRRHRGHRQRGRERGRPHAPPRARQLIAARLRGRAGAAALAGDRSSHRLRRGLTRSRRPEGRRARRHDPARRADERQFRVGVSRHGPPAGVGEMMVVKAQEREVVHVGAPAGFPALHVVHIGEGHVRASGEPAVAVPPHDLPPLGVARLPPGPALVHRVAHVVIDAQGDGGVTGDAADGFAADQTVALEFAGQVARLPRFAHEGGQRHMRHHEVRARGSRPAAGVTHRRADQLEEGIAQSLVPRRLAVGGDPTGPRLEAGPGLGEGLGRQLDAQRPEAVVEAEEPPLVVGRGPGLARPRSSSGPARRAGEPSIPQPRSRARGRSPVSPPLPPRGPCRRRGPPRRALR